MNWIRQTALSGRICGGAWLNLGSSVTAAIAGRAGYDWALIDLEHGSGSVECLLDQLTALEAFPTSVVVRMPSLDFAMFKRVLDLGPAGVMLPQVSTANEARTFVEMLRIPPQGRRGAATTTRASDYGFGYDRYLAEANSNLLGVAQIESYAAVLNVDEIAAVDGIDVLFVGPGDLGTDLQIHGRGMDYTSAVKRVVAAARARGKAAGVLVRSQEEARRHCDLGFSFIALGSDRSMIVSGMKSDVAFLRGVAADHPPSLSLSAVGGGGEVAEN